MTTSTTLIQRAAELVIAFGLDDAETTEQQVRDMAHEGTILVMWHVYRSGRRCSAVELSVFRKTDSVEAFVRPLFSRMRASDAKPASMMYARVIDLAAQIEALR